MIIESKIENFRPLIRAIGRQVVCIHRKDAQEVIGINIGLSTGMFHIYNQFFFFVNIYIVVGTDDEFPFFLFLPRVVIARNSHRSRSGRSYTTR